MKIYVVTEVPEEVEGRLSIGNLAPFRDDFFKFEDGVCVRKDSMREKLFITGYYRRVFSLGDVLVTNDDGTDVNDRFPSPFSPGCIVKVLEFYDLAAAVKFSEDLKRAND